MATTTISGTTDVEDTSLVIYSESIPSGGDSNHGAGDTIMVCMDPNEGSATQSRGVIRCKKAAIPAGTITGLRLCVTNNSLPAQASVYVVKDANTWVEGTSNGAAQSGSSCANKLVYNTTNWAGSVACGTSGTDYFANASPPTIATGAGLKTVTLSASTASDWRDSVVVDNGVLIKLSNEAAFPTGDSLGLWSTEAATAGNRPYWEVDTAAGGASLPVFMRAYRNRRL